MLLLTMIPARRAGWVAVPLLLAAVGCGSVVVEPGMGGATTTGHGEGGATTVVGSSTSGTVTSSSSATATSSSSGGACNPACGFMLTCCNGTCEELDNDPFNCGGCGVVCPGPNPYCHKGACGVPACGGQPCPSQEPCCGGQCCAPGTMCCDDNGGPPHASPYCAMPENGTCPKSCFLCN